MMRDIWRGGVNAWECDEMGHMNVRFYLERMWEGLGAMAPFLGLGQAFRSGATATLVAREQHIRFLKEAHAGTPLFMTGAVIDADETTITLAQTLIHSRGGETAATFLTRLEHVEAKTGRPFAWTDRARAAFAGWRADMPEEARPRSLAFGTPAAEAGHARALALGLTPIARTAVQPGECDGFGRVRLPYFIGRISDGVPNMLAGWRAAVAAEAAQGGAAVGRAGAAVLEYRLVYRAWPQEGDLVDLRSGVMWVREKTHALAHWATDPVGGAAWCTCEAVAITLDLDARKAIPTPPGQRAVLAAQAIEGLGA